jgi:hypothetical protein
LAFQVPVTSAASIAADRNNNIAKTAGTLFMQRKIPSALGKVHPYPPMLKLLRE